MSLFAIRKKTTSKVVGMILALVMMVGVATPAGAAGLTTEQVNSILSLLASFGADQATINNVNSALTGAPVQPGTPSTGTVSYTFTRDLKVGDTGEDVKMLQKVLNADGVNIASSGAGSPGNETTYFGSITKAGVVRFQNKYASEILAPVGLINGTGYVGASTRAKLNMLSATPAPTPTPTPTPTPSVGTGLMVSMAQQPAASLAPENAVRIPFTKVTLTAGNDGAVTVNSLTVERTGLGADAVFSGIVVLDENGTQLGIAKTLNSNHQAVIGDAFTIPAGTSKTVTIAGNMATTLDSYAGQVVSLSVVGVNTSAAVTGVLPVTGAGHTINATLSVGTVTVSRGSIDPGVDASSKEIGTTDYTFSSLRITAGSAEKVRIHSIRWNQSGSASANDLANIEVIVDGTAYATTVSADGKYYTATFGSGIVVDKGLQKEISIRGDILSGSGRTVTFDLYKATDIYITGETYEYGVLADDGNTTVGSEVEGTYNDELTPAYPAYDVTISNGSVSSISKSNTVPAQNIAVLSPNQPLGGFEVEVRGEAISVQQMVFNIDVTSSTASSSDITNISLVDQNGTVIAGPVDGVLSGSTGPDGTVTFTDTVTFPVGKTTLTLKGQMGTGFATNDTVVLTTTPTSNWTTVRGQTTGNSITLPTTGLLSANTMTVKAGALAISVSTQPSSRNVIAGSKGFEFARYTFDAGQSGEDVRMTNIPLLLALSTVTATQLSNCNLYDGDTNVTNDTNVTVAAGDNTFTFNNGGYMVPKGTQKSLSMKCDLAASATSGTVKWGLTNNSSTYASAIAVGSNQTVSETMTASAGQTMTASTSGSYTVTEDSSLLYAMAQAGSTGVTLAKFRFTAGATEDVVLKQVALQLGNTASNSPSDLVGERVSLYNGSTFLGYAQFGGANPDNATSTLTTSVRITKGESVVITVKGDLTAHNANEGTPGAFLAITYDANNNGINGNYATGGDSNVTIDGSTATDVTTSGVRIFRTVPSITVTSNGGTLVAGGDLYKFRVTNSNNRDVVFQKFTFDVATTGGAVRGFTLYGDGVAFNTTAVDTLAATTLEVLASGTSQAQIIPANSSKEFVLRATTAVDTASVSESAAIKLVADTAYPALANNMGTVTSVEAAAAAADNIIWSPFSTTTPVATAATQSNLDWTNGYGMPGFPANTDFPVQVWTRAN